MEELKMSNLKIWDKYKAVPENALKDFDNGNFKGTDINTMWRMKCLTEEFGMCGVGWYYDIININHEKVNEADTIMTFAEIKLYIKVDGEWSKGITGVGGNKMLTKIKLKADGSGGYYKASDEATKIGENGKYYFAPLHEEYEIDDIIKRLTDNDILILEEMGDLTSEEIEYIKMPRLCTGILYLFPAGAAVHFLFSRRKKNEEDHFSAAGSGNGSDSGCLRHRAEARRDQGSRSWQQRDSGSRC